MVISIAAQQLKEANDLPGLGDEAFSMQIGSGNGATYTFGARKGTYSSRWRPAGCPAWTRVKTLVAVLLGQA